MVILVVCPIIRPLELIVTVIVSDLLGGCYTF